jgi:hypothetical protein
MVRRIACPSGSGLAGRSLESWRTSQRPRAPRLVDDVLLAGHVPVALQAEDVVDQPCYLRRKSRVAIMRIEAMPPVRVLAQLHLEDALSRRNVYVKGNREVGGCTVDLVLARGFRPSLDARNACVAGTIVGLELRKR